MDYRSIVEDDDLILSGYMPNQGKWYFPIFVGNPSVATARLKTAEPAEPSCFEPSQAGLPANDQIWLGLAHELGLAG